MVLVFSCGRTGTNLILEVLTGSSYLMPSEPPEDKAIFCRDILYPHNYLTKCDTIYCQCYGLLGKFLKKNKSSKIIWTIRHPFDIAMSKIVRGYKKADDGDFNGCVKDMLWMAYLYNEANCEFPEQIITVKMEDVIMDIASESKRMCNFLNIPFEQQMLTPYLRMRHSGKRKRYPNGLYKNEINKYLNWKKAYDGFLTTIDFDMECLFEKISCLVDFFDYKDERVIK